MKRLFCGVIAVLAFGLISCVESKVGFERIGSQSLTHFVVIEPERAADSATYAAAASSACRRQSLHCVVLFWTDSALAARTLPMTDAQAAAVVARYRLHRPTASNGFGCHPFGTPEQRCASEQGAAGEAPTPRARQRSHGLAGRE